MEDWQEEFQRYPITHVEDKTNRVTMITPWHLKGLMPSASPIECN